MLQSVHGRYGQLLKVEGSMSNSSIKTDHNGAKNGGGHWGTRREAKKVSGKLRRKNAKTEIKQQLAE